MMNAIYFEQTGAAQDVLAVKPFPSPVPGADEVLVKMLGSTINPADLLFIAGNYRFKPDFPQIAGIEGAGIVVANGDNANLPVGALVAFLHKATWAEYAVVPKDIVFVLPVDYPVEKAIQFALNPVTAWGLLQAANVHPGDYLLLSAGNSVVAHLIARFALLRRVNVIAIVRDARVIGPLKSLGVSVINSTEENLEERVQALTHGKGAQCVLDPVGGKTGTQLLSCLGVNGRFIIYGKLDPEPVQLHYPIIQYKSLTISAFGVRGYIQGLSETQRIALVKTLTGIIGDPDFKMEVTATFTMKEYKAAIQAATEGSKTGKVIFKLDQEHEGTV